MIEYATYVDIVDKYLDVNEKTKNILNIHHPIKNTRTTKSVTIGIYCICDLLIPTTCDLMGIILEYLALNNILVGSNCRLSCAKKDNQYVVFIMIQVNKKSFNTAIKSTTFNGCLLKNYILPNDSPFYIKSTQIQRKEQ